MAYSKPVIFGSVNDSELSLAAGNRYGASSCVCLGRQSTSSRGA